MGLPPLVALLGSRDDGPFFVAVAGVSVSVAIILGTGAVARDLAERRLGFYLARPLSPLAYWAGKMSAAFLLAIAAGALAFIPAFCWARYPGWTHAG